MTAAVKAESAVAAVDTLTRRRRTLNTGLRVTVKPLLLAVVVGRSYSKDEVYRRITEILKYIIKKN